MQRELNAVVDNLSAAGVAQLQAGAIVAAVILVAVGDQYPIVGDQVSLAAAIAEVQAGAASIELFGAY